MCRSSWRSALLAAQRQDDPVRLARVGDPTGGEQPPQDVVPLAARRPSPDPDAPPPRVCDRPCCRDPAEVLVRTPELR